MSAFLFALVAVFATSIGSKDQRLVAQVAEQHGRNIGLLLLGALVAAASAAAMAVAGKYVAASLPSAGKTMLVAFAMVMAASELAWPNRTEPAHEPTRSLFAIGIVLLARQIGDASRFLIFAFAAGAGISLFAGLGGALGGIAAIALGWIMAGDLEQQIPLRPIRIALAVIVGMAAVVIGLSARGVL